MTTLTPSSAAPAPRLQPPTASSRVPAREAGIEVSVERVVAVVAVLLTGFRAPLPLEFVPGVFVAVVLLPVWLPAVRSYRGGWLLVVLAGIAMLNGWWLHEWSAADHDVNLSNAIGTTAMLAGIVGGAGVLLWARRQLADPTVAAWLALGLIAAQFFQRGQWNDNPWKFAFVVPVSLLVLAVARMTRHRIVDTLALVGLGVLSAVYDSRSAFALFLLAGALTLWQFVPVGAARRARLGALRTLAVIAVVAAAVYNVGTSLVLEGRLGAAAQERSIEQIERSGSLLLGGRPELAATVALMQARPVGFGPGTLPTSGDVLVAKSGMESIGYDTDNGYVERFMFGTQIRLHSVAGELWAFFGIAGLALVVSALAVLVAALATGLTTRSASGFALWLTCLTAWNALFGPLYGSAAALMAALGLVVVRRASDPVSPADAVGRTPRR